MPTDCHYFPVFVVLLACETFRHAFGNFPRKARHCLTPIGREEKMNGGMGHAQVREERARMRLISSEMLVCGLYYKRKV